MMTVSELLSILEQYPGDAPVELAFMDEVALTDPDIWAKRDELRRLIEQRVTQKGHSAVQALVLFDLGSVRFDKQRLILVEEITSQALDKGQKEKLKSVS